MYTIFLLYFITIKFILSYKTSVCLRENEEFSLCGWKCPATCVNMMLLPLHKTLCPLLWECRVGCRCSAGYIRDEYSKKCVMVHQCPGGPINDRPVKEALPLDDEIDRDRRSHHAVPYTSPCAAASSPVPSYAPAAYQYNMVPAQYNRPYNPYSYNYPHYRTEHEDNEVLSYSDMNHIGTENVPVGMGMMPMTYPGDPRIAILNTPATPVQGVSSFSAFPYSNPNALTMPFLFSCSPSIVPGQMVHAQPQYYTGYRMPDVHGLDTQSILEHQDHQQTEPEHPMALQKTNIVETTTQ